MSFITEVSRLKDAKASIRTAIGNKGVTVPQETKIDGYSAYIDNIGRGRLPLPAQCDRLVLNEYGVMTEVDYNTSVTSLSKTFAYSPIVSISMPSVTDIPSSTFYQCWSLENVSMPSVVTIGSSAFYNCTSLASIDLPATLQSIGSSAFYTTSLTTVICRATTPPVIASGVFYNNYLSAIYVPAESVDAYKAANNWSTYADKIQAIP